MHASCGMANDAASETCADPCYNGNQAAGDRAGVAAPPGAERPSVPYRCAPRNDCHCKGARRCSPSGYCVGDAGVCPVVSVVSSSRPPKDLQAEAAAAALLAQYTCCTYSTLLGEVASVHSVSSRTRCLLLCEASSWCAVVRWNPDEVPACSLLLSWSSVATDPGSEVAVQFGVPSHYRTTTTPPTADTEQLCAKACELSEEELAFRTWDGTTCQQMQDEFSACTDPDNPNHRAIMKNCPAVCARARGEPCQDHLGTTPTRICSLFVTLPARNVAVVGSYSRSRCRVGEWRCDGSSVTVCTQTRVASSLVAHGGWICTEELAQNQSSARESSRAVAVVAIVCVISVLLACCLPAAAWWLKTRGFTLPGKPQLFGKLTTQQQLHQLKVSRVTVQPRQFTPRSDDTSRANEDIEEREIAYRDAAAVAHHQSAKKSPLQSPAWPPARSGGLDDLPSLSREAGDPTLWTKPPMSALWTNGQDIEVLATGTGADWRNGSRVDRQGHAVGIPRATGNGGVTSEIGSDAAGGSAMGRPPKPRLLDLPPRLFSPSQGPPAQAMPANALVDLRHDARISASSRQPAVCQAPTRDPRSGRA